jgi:hypothetical protein
MNRKMLVTIGLILSVLVISMSGCVGNGYQLQQQVQQIQPTTQQYQSDDGSWCQTAGLYFSDRLAINRIGVTTHNGVVTCQVEYVNLAKINGQLETREFTEKYYNKDHSYEWQETHGTGTTDITYQGQFLSHDSYTN